MLSSVSSMSRLRVIGVPLEACSPVIPFLRSFFDGVLDGVEKAFFEELFKPSSLDVESVSDNELLELVLVRSKLNHI